VTDGLRYPISASAGPADRLALRMGALAPIRCPVCGRLSVAMDFSANLRETGRCVRCGATNRNRQMALVACRAVSQMTGHRVHSLRELRAEPGLRVFNTEAQGPLHDQLHQMPGYLCSEYLGPDHAPGDVVDGTMHQDLMQLSFDDGSIDLVLSSDVLEHVPEPYRAHCELARVLAPGGRHVFTVPFHQHEFLDDVRARTGPDGKPQLLAEPIYHDDPVRAEGVLVYTIFGLEMLVRLAEVGFETRMYALRDVTRGIVGPNAIVFEAVEREGGWAPRAHSAAPAGIAHEGRPSPSPPAAPMPTPVGDEHQWSIRGAARAAVEGTLLERPARAALGAARRLRSRRDGRPDLPPIWVEPGHYYSPIPSLADVDAYRQRFGAPSPATLGAIDLRLDAQVSLLSELQPFYAEQPFSEQPGVATRYWFDNPSFGAADALALYGMLRRLRPSRVVEVGTGWSSSVILDTCERFLGWKPELTFVEPYPERFESLLRAGDRDHFRLLVQPVQSVPLEEFTALEDGDVLFIDSTHVARVGSDVNAELFDVLPALRRGVYVHLHDIFYPFEYPLEWVEEGRGWNEAYIVRAFLEYNDAFEIVLFNDFVAQHARARLERDFPLWLTNTGGSLWMRKVRGS
jgi:SAM-dependent methyltransferase